MGMRCRKCRRRFRRVGPKTKCTPECGRKPCRPTCKVAGGCGREGCRKHSFTLDAYRQRCEVDIGARKLGKVCRCGEYEFPHRKGSGVCEHNARMTIEERQLRWEDGFKARKRR